MPVYPAVLLPEKSVHLLKEEDGSLSLKMLTHLQDWLKGCVPDLYPGKIPISGAVLPVH